MSDPNKTDPGIKETLKKATERTDPWADRILESAKESSYTPWLIAAAVILCIIFGVIVSRG